MTQRIDRRFFRAGLVRFASGLSICAFSASSALAQGPIEVSKDGHISVSILPDEIHRGESPRGRSGFVPYTQTPDWTLALRRQVGSVRVADMNGDGLNDLVVGCYISSSFPPYTEWRDMIFYNIGGTLEASPSWISADQIHTGDIQIGDVNMDGHLDVVAISGGTAFSPVRIYFGSSTGPSTSPGWIASPPRSGWATSGTLFDVDNDGDLDLLTTNQGVSPDPYRPMHLFFNDNGALSTTVGWQSDESSIQNTTAAADFDGDGDLDIAVAKWANFESAIYENTGTTLATTPLWTNGTTNTDRGVAWSDIDGNGSPDLVIGEGPSKVWTNDGGVLSFGYTVVPPFNGVQEMAFRDVDLDGDEDFAEVHFSDGRTHIYLNEEGVLAGVPSWTFDATTVANAIDFGDINGDGWPDLVIGYSGDVSVRVFFAVPLPCVADYNGDGVSDVLDLLDFLDDFSACEQQPLPCGAHGAPDLNGDTAVDVLDFLDFLNAFSEGC